MSTSHEKLLTPPDLPPTWNKKAKVRVGGGGLGGGGMEIWVVVEDGDLGGGERWERKI